MAGFVYCVRGTARDDPAMLEERTGIGGFGSLARPLAMECPPELAPAQFTPGEALLLFDGEQPEAVEWAQHGRAFGDQTEQFAIGWRVGARPRPRDLAKPYAMAAGEWLRLADGNEWFIPRVLPCTGRDPSRACGLPYAERDDAPVAKWRVPDVFDPLVEFAQRLVRMLETGEVRHLPDRDDLMKRFAALTLSVGYRVQLAESDALGLFRAPVEDPPQRRVLAVVSAAIDFEEIQRCSLEQGAA